MLGAGVLARHLPRSLPTWGFTSLGIFQMLMVEGFILSLWCCLWKIKCREAERWMCAVVWPMGINTAWVSVCIWDVDQASSDSTYEKWRLGLGGVASRGKHVLLLGCLVTLQDAFHFMFTVCFSCLFICFFGFLLRKWHIFSTSTPPIRPSSKT